jgi:hypothetical protein
MLIRAGLFALAMVAYIGCLPYYFFFMTLHCIPPLGEYWEFYIFTPRFTWRETTRYI